MNSFFGSSFSIEIMPFCSVSSMLQQCTAVVDKLVFSNLLHIYKVPFVETINSYQLPFLVQNPMNLHAFGVP